MLGPGVGDVRPRYAFLFTDVIVLCVAVVPEPARQSGTKKDKEVRCICVIKEEELIFLFLSSLRLRR